MFIGSMVASSFGRVEVGDKGRLYELNELRGVKGDIDPESGKVFRFGVFSSASMS